MVGRWLLYYGPYQRERDVSDFVEDAQEAERVLSVRQRFKKGGSAMR